MNGSSSCGERSDVVHADNTEFFRAQRLAASGLSGRSFLALCKNTENKGLSRRSKKDHRRPSRPC